MRAEHSVQSLIQQAKNQNGCRSLCSIILPWCLLQQRPKFCVDALEHVFEHNTDSGARKRTPKNILLGAGHWGSTAKHWIVHITLQTAYNIPKVLAESHPSDEVRGCKCIVSTPQCEGSFGHTNSRSNYPDGNLQSSIKEEGGSTYSRGAGSQ